MKLLLLSFLLLTTFLPAQNQNVTLLGSLNPHAADGYNDCWGYTDSQGREYALLGVQTGTSIIDITNAAQPVEVAFIPGPHSLWRDIKTHGHYAYATTEGTTTGTGLQIMDLSQLPDTAVNVKSVSTWFTSAHNLYIADGYCYVVGASSSFGSGIQILSLADPENPVKVGYYGTSGYVHDVYVWNDTAYASSEDTYDLVNVTNKANPVRISQSAALSGIYAHSGWLTEDKRYFVACEEFNVRDVTVWDLQDRTTWDLVVPTWQMAGSGNTNSPVHNIFIKGNYAHISYYKDGYVVLDISDPQNPQRVGWYDTYPGTTSNTYTGAWGCYPFFTSGKVIASDMVTGLYVMDFLLDNNTPVELSSFTASAVNNKVILNWATATETNNRGFVIQQSVDKARWNEIGFVNGAGTTTKKKEYTFEDKNPLAGKAYYRLVQTDFDGTQKIYDAVEVIAGAPAEFALHQNYPNPFNPSTTISFNLTEDSFVNMEVYNITGEKVSTLLNEKRSAGKNDITFNAANLPSGIYLARINAGGNIRTIKMALMK